MSSPLDPVADWETIRELPEGAALADAYLTLRDEFRYLVVMAQVLVKGQAGMTLEIFGQEVERRVPLLEEPYGREWTEAYWQTELRRSRAASALREGLLALGGERA